MTQQDLAVALGKAVVTVARWETSHIPSTTNLAAIAALAQRQGLDELAAEFAGYAMQRAGINQQLAALTSKQNTCIR